MDDIGHRHTVKCLRMPARLHACSMQRCACVFCSAYSCCWATYFHFAYFIVLFSILFRSFHLLCRSSSNNNVVVVFIVDIAMLFLWNVFFFHSSYYWCLLIVCLCLCPLFLRLSINLSLCVSVKVKMCAHIKTKNSQNSFRDKIHASSSL